MTKPRPILRSPEARATKSIQRRVHDIQRAPAIVRAEQLLLPPPNKRIVTPRPNLRQSSVKYYQIDQEHPSRSSALTGEFNWGLGIVLDTDTIWGVYWYGFDEEQAIDLWELNEYNDLFWLDVYLSILTKYSITPNPLGDLGFELIFWESNNFYTVSSAIMPSYVYTGGYNIYVIVNSSSEEPVITVTSGANPYEVLFTEYAHGVRVTVVLHIADGDSGSSTSGDLVDGSELTVNFTTIQDYIHYHVETTEYPVTPGIDGFVTSKGSTIGQSILAKIGNIKFTPVEFEIDTTGISKRWLVGGMYLDATQTPFQRQYWASANTSINHTTDKTVWICAASVNWQNQPDDGVCWDPEVSGPAAVVWGSPVDAEIIGEWDFDEFGNPGGSYFQPACGTINAYDTGTNLKILALLITGPNPSISATNSFTGNPVSIGTSALTAHEIIEGLDIEIDSDILTEYFWAGGPVPDFIHSASLSASVSTDLSGKDALVGIASGITGSFWGGGDSVDIANDDDVASGDATASVTNHNDGGASFVPFCSHHTMLLAAIRVRLLGG